MEVHLFEKYLVASIDQRFSKFNTINQQALETKNLIDPLLLVDESRFGSGQWSELRDKESFLELLKHFEQLFKV